MVDINVSIVVMDIKWFMLKGIAGISQWFGYFASALMLKRFQGMKLMRQRKLATMF